jgi:hypothetical protein
MVVTGQMHVKEESWHMHSTVIGSCVTQLMGLQALSGIENTQYTKIIVSHEGELLLTTCLHLDEGTFQFKFSLPVWLNFS